MTDTSVVLAILAVAFAAPYLFHRYLERLPEAPACPSCRTVTRDAGTDGWAAHLAPVLLVTIVRECSRCGWKGRMRWRWAERRADGRRGD